MVKKRLDLMLVEQKLIESRSLAQRMIMAGRIRVNGELALKPSLHFAENAKIEILQPMPFVSRGGEKLEAAFNHFGISVLGLACADIGSSTGGFTDCLLQRGARHVYAIDVGKGILEWKLRNDERVTVMEGVNARFLSKMSEQVQLVTIDVSFISVKNILPVVRNWGGHLWEDKLEHEEGENHFAGGESPTILNVVALIKPQFEAGRADVSRGGGVIRDAAIHKRVLVDILTFSQQIGYSWHGLIRSPLVGPKGNIEFLCWLQYPATIELLSEESIVEQVESSTVFY